MFKKKPINYCLLFKNCNSIHTFFMRQSIDIVMTNEHNDILFMYENLKPSRIILPKKNVTRVYELPLGSISKIKNS